MVQGRDTRVIEAREQAGFALEACEPLRISIELGQHQLERDLTSEPGVVGAPDLAHAAAAEQAEKLIAAGDEGFAVLVATELAEQLPILGDPLAQPRR